MLRKDSALDELKSEAPFGMLLALAEGPPSN